MFLHPAAALCAQIASSLLINPVTANSIARQLQMPAVTYRCTALIAAYPPCSGSFYPGTGAAAEVGNGAGAGFNVNVAWSGPGMVCFAYCHLQQDCDRLNMPRSLPATRNGDQHAATAVPTQYCRFTASMCPDRVTRTTWRRSTVCWCPSQRSSRQR